METISERQNEKILIRKTILTACLTLCIVYSFAQTANFTANITSGCSPLVVNFSDQSTGNITSWSWDFGNGGTSTLKNPSATYFTPGTYTVKLTVTSGFNSNTITKTNYITVYGKPSVNFKASDSVGCFPLRAQFTDLSVASTGTTNTSWLWDFGDGTQSGQQNPLHIYNTAGNYTVTLKVTNDKGCSATVPKVAYIKISGGVKTVFGNTMPNVCRPPFNINFSDSSTGPGTLSYLWNFGDGNTSTQQNPSHAYAAPGSYSVFLVVTSSNGCIDTLIKNNLLNIQNINTTFTGPDSVCVNATASFLNTSAPAPSYSVWNFGDAGSSSAINPSHVYSTVGTYTVKLTNAYSYCTDSFSKAIKIIARPVANFTLNDSTRCKPNLTVNFQDLSTNAVSWQWLFGDGGTSTQQNPTHTYTNYGTYTVQLVVTNSSGCTDTIRKQNLVQIIKPTISFPPLPVKGCIPYTLNANAAISTLDVVTSYNWNFGDGFTSPLATPSHTYTTQGNYTVSLTITTSTGCTETNTLPGAVKVGRKPVVNFNAVPNPACAYQNVYFTDQTNEADEWLWFFGDGSTSNQQNPVHQYADTGWMNVKLVATNNGCTDSLRLNNFIRIKPPIAKFGYQTNCNNRFLFNFVDSSVGATSWFWDFGDGTNSTQQSPTHTFPGYNTYNVSLTVSNDTCSHTITKTIKVFDETPDFSASFTTSCRPRLFHFSAIGMNPANIVEYFWDFGDGNTWNSNVNSSGNLSYNYYYDAGYYTVTLITTDIYGCKDTVVKTNYIRVNGPAANFTAANTSGCKGLTTTFTDLSVGDGISNIVSWQWNFGDGTVQTFNAPPFQHTYLNTGTYSVKLIVTDAGGCKDSVTSVNLITTTSPQANFYADTLLCPGNTSRFTNTSNAINFNSAWYFGDNGTSTTTSPTHQYNTTGLFTVKLVITDQYGCSDSLIRPSYVKVARPVASFTVNDSISSCTPFEVHFANTSTYWNYLSWNLGGGSSVIENPTQFYTVPGVYQVSLIAISPGGCEDTARSTITVYDTAGANVTYLPLNGCKPLNLNISAYSPGPMEQYTWDFGDGTLLTTPTNSTNHVYNFFGNFVPKVILTDPAGCLIPVNGLDTIRIIGAYAKFGYDKKFFCDSGWVNFTDSTLFNDNVTGYNWDFGDGTSSNLQNPSHHYTAPGIYSVTMNVQTQNACVDTFRLNNIVKIVESPLVRIDGDSIICLNDSLLHFGVFQRPDTSVVKWAWNFPNGNISVLQNPLPQKYKTVGNFVVTTIATNSSGCKDTATKTIRVNPLPTVTMPTSITKQAGFPVTLPANYSAGVNNWNWNPAQTLDCQTCPQPIANPKFNTLYSVGFVDNNGCKNTGLIQVIVLCKDANVFVPNTFSPNGDGSNDIFYVRGKGLDRVKSIRVFNRWGEVVFEQQNFPVNNPGYGWNGMYKGNKPVPDVYIYQVEVFCENSQIIRFEGNVALIQ